MFSPDGTLISTSAAPHCGVETDSFARKRTVHHLSSNSRFDLYSPKALRCCFQKQHSHVFCVLSEEACLCAASGLLALSVSQRVVRGHLLDQAGAASPLQRQAVDTRSVSTVNSEE